MNGKFTTVIILLSLLISSCSSSYKVRTSRAQDVKRGDIIQMPTVVDLDVDATVVKRDTVWTTTPFRRGNTLKAQVNNVTYCLLNSVNADVLMQPSVAHDVTRANGIITHHLTVSGFPAHYRRFRTITLDDVKAINSLCKDANSENCSLIVDYRQATPANKVQSRGFKDRVQRVKPVYKPKNSNILKLLKSKKDEEMQ